MIDKTPPPTKRSAQSAADQDIRGLLTFAAFAFLLPAIAVSGTIAAVGLVNQSALTRPEVELPIVLIATVLALIGGLTFMVIVLHYMRLTTRGTALGMPDGSIRAIIAISLLFLFMILSIFLYENMVTSADPNARAASADVAKQLVTTVSTLAVSVAGFYFGTSSVAAANRAVSRVQVSLSIVSPTQPVVMATAQGTVSPQIRLLAVPGDQAIASRVIGDADVQLVQMSPGVFVYTRGAAAADNVILEFYLVGSPDVKAQLEIIAG